MIKSLLRFVVLVALAFLIVSCANFQTSDFPLIVQLPASKQCFEIKVMSGSEKRYPVDQCEKIKERAILLTSEAWKMIRSDIQVNCQNAQCVQIQGAADSLFLAIDQALQKVPF
jgi:hypothetical protein